MVLVIVSCGQVWIINSWFCTFNLSSPITQQMPLTINQRSSNMVCSHCPEKLLFPSWPAPISHPTPRSWYSYLINTLFLHFKPGVFLAVNINILEIRGVLSFLDSMVENCLVASIYFFFLLLVVVVKIAQTLWTEYFPPTLSHTHTWISLIPFQAPGVGHDCMISIFYPALYSDSKMHM